MFPKPDKITVLIFLFNSRKIQELQKIILKKYLTTSLSEISNIEINKEEKRLLN